MKRIHPLIPAIFALLVVLVPVGAAAQVAMMNFSSSAVTWSPMLANDGMTLTVSGGGVWFQKSFKSGASPRFDTFDAEGNALPDGVYKWELSARPARTAGDRGEWENARTNADGSFVRHGTAERIEPQSGIFRIANGSIVDPNGASEGGGAAGGGIGGVGGGGGKGASGAAGPGTNDQVIVDDLIVDGSICAGFDCVNGEPFGFDTLKLKENNLRIKFQDTSNSASFPTNDWQITANDTSNGGQNKFSIDDIDGGRTPFTIEASAPSHSLYVDDGGRLGLGTSTPVADIHVKSGNTPTLRLEQDGSSGFTPQTWDMAGNEANFFIRDASNGSTLPFRVFPGAPTNALSIEGMTGDVGIGTNSPNSNAKLDVRGQMQINRDGVSTSALGDLHIRRDGAAAASIVLQNDDTRWQFNATSTAGGQFEIFNASNGGTPFKILESAPGNLMTLDSGGVKITGVVQHPPDYVFEPDYDLKPINEHAEAMWQNKHLPAVGPGGDEINLVGHQYGILEELEVAHIYIAQLHERLEQRDAQLDEVLERLAELESKVQQ